MAAQSLEIENLLELSDEVLLAKLFSPRTPSLEWVAVSAVVDQRIREKSTKEESVGA